VVAHVFPGQQTKGFVNAIKRKIEWAQGEVSKRNLAFSINFVQEAHDCLEYHSARKTEVKSWVLTYGNWLKKALSPPPWATQPQQTKSRAYYEPSPDERAWFAEQDRKAVERAQEAKTGPLRLLTDEEEHYAS